MKKRLIKKLKVTIDKNMRDYSQEEAFVKHLARANEVLKNSKFPGKIVTSK